MPEIPQLTRADVLHRGDVQCDRLVKVISPLKLTLAGFDLERFV